MFVDPNKIAEQFGFSPGMRVADLGSGVGFYTLATARLVGNAGRVYAVDIRPEMLQQIKTLAEREHLNNVEVIHGDLEEPKGTRLKDGSVDAVIVANTLFQLEEPEHCAEEAMRIVKKDGNIFVIDWKESFGGIGPHKDDVIREEKAKEMFEKVGCIVVKDVNAQNYHYGFVCKAQKNN